MKVIICGSTQWTYNEIARLHRESRLKGKCLLVIHGGEPAVVSVNKTVEIFKCGPHKHLPDIFVEWKPGCFMERVLHPEAELTQKKPEFFRRSDHSSCGFFTLAGPSVKTGGKIDNIEVLDIAPTFLSLLGEHVPDVMAGRELIL